MPELRRPNVNDPLDRSGVGSDWASIDWSRKAPEESSPIQPEAVASAEMEGQPAWTVIDWQAAAARPPRTATAEPTPTAPPVARPRPLRGDAFARTGLVL